MDPLNDTLSKLKDIHEPSVVSWWPLAIGWWLLLLAVVLLGILSWWILRKRNSVRPVAFKKLLLQEINVIKAMDDPATVSIELNKLLKRCAQYRDPDGGSASLHGSAWAQYLVEKLGFTGISKEEIESLLNANYQKEFKVDPQKMLIGLTAWARSQP
ncbi:MAG: DUF4381 domain-containing protein [Gammaproteobacteria bacterium]|nr:DUF4381 domain-containing protein [Gammaproteobacteria bacterium]MDH5692266.1 DUF4381 domain-containing protein [Gammaproteobacteria bacterium]